MNNEKIINFESKLKKMAEKDKVGDEEESDQITNILSQLIY